MSLETELDGLGQLLQETAAEHGVVGASLAVGRGDELFESVTGHVNIEADVETTPDSVFQIGSIAKLFTATLAMQLVDDGLIELETPVWTVLPEFEVADRRAGEEITLAHLLSHSSGIDGDHFLDTGNGDDCIERFVLACSALSQLHRPGERFSYCNVGFVIAGRIIERLRGKPWHIVLKERILEPLGLTAAGTESEQAILHRAAVGHMQRTADGAPAVIPVWRLPRSNGPAGATLFARARDLIPFANLHLKRGVTPDGRSLLSTRSVEAMQSRRVRASDYARVDGVGLGWMLFDWGERRIIGHDGATIGQASYLRVDPETSTVVSLLTTGGDSGALYRDVFASAMGAFESTELPPPLAPSEATDITLDRYVGSFARLSVKYVAEIEDGCLNLSAEGSKKPMSLLPPARTKLQPVSRGTFAVEHPSALIPSPVIFGNFDASGRPGHVEIGLRTTPRVAETLGDL